MNDALNIVLSRTVDGLREQHRILEQKLELLEWALHGNQCWIGTTIIPGENRAEYVACYQPRPYAAPETVPGSQDTDSYHCLRKARQWLSEQQTAGK